MTTRIPADVLAMVRPDMRDDFADFIRTGQISKRFEEFLDRDRDAQRAVGQILKGRLGAVGKLGAAITGQLETPSLPEVTFDARDEALLISQALLDVANREEAQRREIVELVASFLQMHAESLDDVAHVLDELTHSLRQRTRGYAVAGRYQAG